MAQLTALCQVQGMLVIAEFTPRPGVSQKCPMPHCDCTRMYKRHGWLHCEDCGFAILLTDLDKIQVEAGR